LQREPAVQLERRLRLERELQLEELDGEDAEERGRDRQVDLEPGTALEAHAVARVGDEADLERHLDVAARQLPEEAVAVAERDDELALADREPERGVVGRDFGAERERADLEPGRVRRADDERRGVRRRVGALAR